METPDVLGRFFRGVDAYCGEVKGRHSGHIIDPLPVVQNAGFVAVLCRSVPRHSPLRRWLKLSLVALNGLPPCADTEIAGSSGPREPGLVGVRCVSEDACANEKVHFDSINS